MIDIARLKELAKKFAHTDAMTEYTENLIKSERLRYLLDRGIQIGTVEHFELGILKDRTSKLFDRLLFPITNEYGELLAYQGRAFDNEKKPKYWHQPFDKKRVLYGLSYVLPLIIAKRFCVVVEGNVDVLTLWQMGVPAVAVQGTALTFEQSVLLRTFTDAVVLCYDFDESGKKASENAKKLLESCKFEIVGVIPHLHGCKDVNEMSMKHADAKEKFWELLT